MPSIEELRQYKIGEYAIFDFSVSFLVVWFLSPILSKIFKRFGIKVPYINWLFLTLPFGILVHILTDNITPMTEDFLDPNGGYFIKGLIVLLTVLGFTGIRRIKYVGTVKKSSN